MNKSPIRIGTPTNNSTKKRNRPKLDRFISSELKPMNTSTDSENTLPNTPPKSNSKRDTYKTSPKRHPKHVSFKFNFLQVIPVESYKKYNSENTCDEPSYNVNNRGNNRNGKVHCKCSTF